MASDVADSKAPPLSARTGFNLFRVSALHQVCFITQDSCRQLLFSQLRDHGAKGMFLLGSLRHTHLCRQKRKSWLIVPGPCGQPHTTGGVNSGLVTSSTHTLLLRPDSKDGTEAQAVCLAFRTALHQIPTWGCNLTVLILHKQQPQVQAQLPNQCWVGRDGESQGAWSPGTRTRSRKS